MSDVACLARPRCYEDLLEILRGQMDKLGVGINQVDEICGLPTGYAAKIFGPSRTRKLGHKSLWLLAPELGIRVELHEDAQLLEKRREPSRSYVKYKAHFGGESQAPGIHVLTRVLRHIGRIGGKARMRKMRKKELREHQSNAAKARWKQRREKRKARAARILPESPKTQTGVKRQGNKRAKNCQVKTILRATQNAI